MLPGVSLLRRGCTAVRRTASCPQSAAARWATGGYPTLHRTETPASVPAVRKAQVRPTGRPLPLMVPVGACLRVGCSCMHCQVAEVVAVMAGASPAQSLGGQVGLEFFDEVTQGVMVDFE